MRKRNLVMPLALLAVAGVLLVAVIVLGQYVISANNAPTSTPAAPVADDPGYVDIGGNLRRTDDLERGVSCYRSSTWGDSGAIPNCVYVPGLAQKVKP